jgi:hypothetical protein
MSFGSDEIGIIRHGDRMVSSKDAIVFDDYNHGIDDIDPFPNPVVVAVKVNAQQPDLAAESRAFDEAIDIIGVYERADYGHIISPI